MPLCCVGENFVWAIYLVLIPELAAAAYKRQKEKKTNLPADGSLESKAR